VAFLKKRKISSHLIDEILVRRRLLPLSRFNRLSSPAASFLKMVANCFH